MLDVEKSGRPGASWPPLIGSVIKMRKMLDRQGILTGKWTVAPLLYPVWVGFFPENNQHFHYPQKQAWTLTKKKKFQNNDFSWGIKVIIRLRRITTNRFRFIVHIEKVPFISWYYEQFNSNGNHNSNLFPFHWF